MTSRNMTEKDSERHQGRRGRVGLYLVWKKKERSQKLSAAVITLN